MPLSSILEPAVRMIIRTCFYLCALLYLAACTTAGTSSTYDGSRYDGPAFRNVLVIATINNFNDRADFERTLAADISSGGTTAQPFFRLADKETPIDRESIKRLASEHKFDGVLITQVVNDDIESKARVGTPRTKATVKDHALFRYDYKELNEPVRLTMDLDAVLSSRLYSVATEEAVWSIEANLARQPRVDLAIVEASEVIAERLRRDDMLVD